jgi:HEAT repeat protein
MTRLEARFGPDHRRLVDDLVALGLDVESIGNLGAAVAPDYDIAAGVLIEYLHSTDNAHLKTAIALSLLRVSSPRVVPEVAAEMLREDVSLVGWNGLRPAIESLRLTYGEVIRQRAKPRDMDVVAAVIRASYLGWTRAPVVEALGRMRQRDVVVSLLAACLEDESPGVRLAALKVVRRIRSAELRSEVTALLNDPEDLVRRAASLALGAIERQD